MSKLSDLTFHNQHHYITQNYSKKHNGTDYGTSRKKIKIYPIEDGKVTYVGKDSYGANIVKIYYPRIDKTFIYGHMDKVDVKKGDNLSKIAKKYNTTWKKIYEKNKDVIGSNPNLIYPGQILKI